MTALARRRSWWWLAGLLLAALSSCDDTSTKDTSAGGDAANVAGAGAAGVGPASSGAGAGSGVACGERETHEGDATYYTFADGSGNCSFPATPNDLLVAAMNDVDYAGSQVCGACVQIDGPNGSVTVRIVDRCPGCPAGDIDLSPQAFEQIAELSAGRVPIHWQYSECPIESPVVFQFKDGSNPWWTAVQVRNHRHAVRELAYRNDAGDWVDVERLDYNYFVESNGMGPGPYAFRVRDVMGNELVAEGIPFSENGEVAASSQFPPCE